MLKFVYRNLEHVTFCKTIIPCRFSLNCIVVLYYFNMNKFYFDLEKTELFSDQEKPGIFQ